MMLRTIFAAVLFIPVYMFASIAGTYEVAGVDPLSFSKYNATLVIEKNDSGYSAHWAFPDGSFDNGTGVRHDNSISFVFNENNSSSFGVQLYEIHGDLLKGPWVRYQAAQSGYEIAQKMHNN